MRSEGFPLLVGVWGWTCVRVVLVVSSSCRRRCVVNFSPLGGTHALRHNPFLQSMKSGGRLARNARFGAPKSQNGRSFSRFAWQAQYFGNASMQVRRFFVAGAAFGECLGKWRKLRKSHTCWALWKWLYEIWRKSRTKCSFWRFTLSRWEVIFAFRVAGARFWKLLAWKVEEASHEMLVLEPCCFKSWGFRSFCSPL